MVTNKHNNDKQINKQKKLRKPLYWFVVSIQKKESSKQNDKQTR